MAPQLAYIGLGNMGSVRDLQYRKQEESVSTGPTNPDPQGMAKNLVEKGNLSKPLILYNRTLSTAEELANKLGGEGKAIVAKSVEDVVAKSDIIFTCLSNDKAILSVMEAALKGEVKGKLFVDNSTVHPDTTDTLNKKATEAGAEFVASPGRNDPFPSPSTSIGVLIRASQCSAPPPWPKTGNLSASSPVPHTSSRRSSLTRRASWAERTLTSAVKHPARLRS